MTKPFPLRQWNRQNLTEDDFGFAISTDRKAWTSLTHQLWKGRRQAAKRVVADMLEWELFRELDDPQCVECKRQPYLSDVEHQQCIRNVLDLATRLKLSQIEPLCEVPLADAVKRNQELSTGIDAGVRLHALEIERDEKTDITVQRFRNWLVALKREPGPRSIVEIRAALARRGRLSYDVLLRALAVRRLKEAGHDRKQAEEMLGVAPYALNPLLKTKLKQPPNGKEPRAPKTNLWNMLPRLALRVIESFAGKIAPLYAPRRTISSL